MKRLFTILLAVITLCFSMVACGDFGNAGSNPDGSGTGNNTTNNDNIGGGNADDGNTDDGNTDDGNTDDGNTDDGNTDDGNTDGDTEKELTYEEQVAEDEEMLAQKWAALANDLGADTALALQKLYSLYGDNLADWTASLYARGFMNAELGIYAGGFYESISGRDNVGFGPDVEATVQMLRFIQQSGMIDHLGNDLKTAIPKWMQQEMIFFAKSLQAEDNGYFYHPQWNRKDVDAKLSRRGRDLGWATSLLSTFGSAPTYDTPNGIYGDGITAEEYLKLIGKANDFDSLNTYPEKSLTLPLGASARSRVSLAAAKSSSNSADFLSDFESFIDFVHSNDVDTLPYYSLFNSTLSQITAASAKMGRYAPDESVTDEKYLQYTGMTFKEISVKYLTERINPKTGLWGKDWEEYNRALDEAGDTSTPRKTGTEYKYTNGLHTNIVVYNNWKIAYPYPLKAAESLIQCLLGDEESTGNICELYNVWYCIVEIKNNATKFCDPQTSREVTDYIKNALAERGAEAIDNTYQKLKRYQRADGGFSHNIYEGTKKNQGMPTGLGLDEGNVDAVCIGTTGMVRVIFDAFGYERVPILTKSDWMRYMNIIEESEPVYKAPSSSSVITFDGTAITPLIKYDGTAMVRGGVLCFGADGACAEISRSRLSGFGDAVLFESDFIIQAGSTVKIALSADEEVFFFEISAHGTGHTLTLGEKSAEIDTAPGKLITVNLEAYIRDSRLFVNINLKGKSISESFDAKKDLCISDISTALIYKNGSTLFIDNLLFVLSAQTTHRFDTYPDINFISPKAENTLAAENGVLHYHRETNADGTQSYFDLFSTYKASDANTVIFSTDIMIESGNTNPIELVLMPMNSSKTERVHKSVFSIVGTDIYYSNERLGHGSGIKKTDIGADLGEWFNLRIEYFEGDIESDNNSTYTIRVYINGNLITENQDVYSAVLDADAVDTLRFAPYTAFIGDIYFDNTSLSQSLVK